MGDPVINERRRRPAPWLRLAGVWGLMSAVAPDGFAQVPQAQVPAGSAVAVVVKVPAPWYAPKALIWHRMRATVGDYDRLPGLAFKAYAIAEADGHYGGLYLWKDESSARSWFSPAWHARVRQQRGEAAEVRFYEVPVAIDNVPGGTPAHEDGPYVSTLVTQPIPADVSRARLVDGFLADVARDRVVAGLLRKYCIIGDGVHGGIYLWKDRQAAEQWVDGIRQAAARRRDAAQPHVEWFDSAILTPSQLAGNQPDIPGLRGAP